MSRRKQSVRLYLDVDTYRQLLIQAANTADVKARPTTQHTCWRKH